MKRSVISCLCIAFLCVFCTVNAQNNINEQAKQQANQAMLAIEKYKLMSRGMEGKSELFVDAAKLVNSVLSTVTDRPEYEFLASYIYRSAGADSLARQHFRKGCFTLESAIAQNPGDAKLYLQYGVAMLCGDTTYWSDYKDYFHQGIEYIRKSYGLVQGKNNLADELYTRSLAEVLMGDVAAFVASFYALGIADKKGKYRLYIQIMNECMGKDGWNIENLTEKALGYLKNDFFGVKI